MQRQFSFIANSTSNNEQSITTQSTYQLIGYNFYQGHHYTLPAQTPINELSFEFLFILLGAYQNNCNIFHTEAIQEKPIENEKSDDENNTDTDTVGLMMARGMHKNAMKRLSEYANLPVTPPKTYQQINAAFDQLLTELARQGVKLCQARKDIQADDVSTLINVIEKSIYMRDHLEMKKLLSELRQFNSAPKP